VNQSRENSKQKSGLKVISILLAVLLWSYVVNEGAYKSPQSAVEVNLAYCNIAEGMQVDGPDTVTVKLWGVFKETGEITASVDLAGKEKGVYNLPVQLQPVSGVMFTSVEPRQVSVTLKEMEETIVPINYQITANPPAGYELLDIVSEPEHCLIKGNQDEVSQVTSVIYQLDLSNTTSIKTFVHKLIAMDNDGSPTAAEIDIYPQTVKAIAVVSEIQERKEVPITVRVEGEPAAGYRLKNTNLQTDTANIIGNKMEIEAINEINTGKIDISEVYESFRRTVDLQVPTGIKLYPSEVIVEIEIEKIPENEEEE